MNSDAYIRKIEPEKWSEWDAFALAQRDGTLFHSSLWLNAQPETETEIFGLYKAGQLIGGTALAVKKRWGQLLIPQPRMTPYYGPVFSDALVLNSSLPAACQLLLSEVYARYDAFTFNLPPQAVQTAQTFCALMPQQLPAGTCRGMRTNRISGRQPEILIESYSGTSQRRYIRRAIKNRELKAEVSTDFELLYSLSEESFRTSGRKHPYPKKDFLKLASCLHEHGLAHCIVVRYGTEAVAAYWVPFDRHTAYYIASGIRQKYRHLHAGPFALHLMISFAMEQQLVFDFEGSMIENINRFFQTFGPEMSGYVHFKSVHSSMVRYLSNLKLIRF